MKRIIMIIACLCVLSSSVIAEERLECFVINAQEICLTHEEIITLTIEMLKTLKHK